MIPTSQYSERDRIMLAAYALGCVKKSEPEVQIFLLWFLIVMGPPDSGSFSIFFWKLLTCPMFNIKILTKNGQTKITKKGKFFKVQ